MHRISTKIWSHLSIDSGERSHQKDIVVSKPYTISSFRDLVIQVAEISFRNSEQVLFYRGQKKDFTKRFSDGRVASSFYPSIYRGLSKDNEHNHLTRRYDTLVTNSKRLINKFAKEKYKGYEKLSKYPEIAWALLQHYEICQTPLLDVTQSLRVAASFALTGEDKEGYLYVFGFPYPNGSISFSVDLEMINIRLLSICPPGAKRPYFQEGFLVGSFPSSTEERLPNHDIGVRLIAKFKLDAEHFWDNDFQPIPRNALLPNDDNATTFFDGLLRGV